MDGFFGKRLYAISSASRLEAKLPIERCLVLFYVADILEFVVGGFDAANPFIVLWL